MLVYASNGKGTNKSVDNETGPDYDIMFSTASDAVWPFPDNPYCQWQLPAPLASVYADKDKDPDREPAVATDGSTWIAVWSSAVSNPQPSMGLGPDYDILFASSKDQGKTWSAPLALNSNAVGDLGDDISPTIATNGTEWVVLWSSNDDLNGTIGTDYDILMSSSSDQGKTWTPPAALHNNAGSDKGHDTSPRLATDGKQWVAVWESSEDGGTGPDYDILTARFSLSP